MDSLGLVSAGVVLGVFLESARGYFTRKPKRSRIRTFKGPAREGEIKLRKAYTVGGKIKPKYNTDDKAFKAEQDQKRGQ